MEAFQGPYRKITNEQIPVFPYQTVHFSQKIARHWKHGLSDYFERHGYSFHGLGGNKSNVLKQAELEIWDLM